ncbi:MAG: tetratricopeptide repeat protein [Cyanothece sp. SIO1E1]|nr:tetratricopeptide repeat protein [Cyanothece sp. SIO1E1]
MVNPISRCESKSYEFWYSQGETLANLGHYEPALASFDRALSLQPQHSETWVFRGVVLLHLSRYQEALNSCEQALVLQPGNTEALIFQGAALQHLGRYQRAYTSYNQALQNAHERGKSHHTLTWQGLAKRFKRLVKLSRPEFPQA